MALGYDPETTMKFAQALFDAGHITYHRTDDPNLADEAIIEIKAYAQKHGLALAPGASLESQSQCPRRARSNTSDTF